MWGLRSSLLPWIGLWIGSAFPVFAEPATPLPGLTVSRNHRYLVRADGRPFFWLGDTAWALHQNLQKNDVLHYLADAAAKHFTLIQLMSVNLWALDHGKNAYGDAPYLGGAPWRLNPPYWNYLAWVIDRAADRGLYVLLVIGAPGRKDHHGPFCRTPAEAYRYGRAVGMSFRRKTNLVWGLGMDVNPDDPKRAAPMGLKGWSAMAEGVADGVAGKNGFDGVADWSAVVMTYHPRGRSTSSKWFHTAPWLDFNGAQVGLRPANSLVDMISGDSGRTPIKPVVDLEPWYEGSTWKTPPVNAWEARAQAWQAIFAGACGYTYGNWNIYGFDSPVEGGKGRWRRSLDSPGRRQMQHLRALLERFPPAGRRPMRHFVIASAAGGHVSRAVQRRIAALGGGEHGPDALVYTPRGESFTVALDRLREGPLTCRWFDPRTGGFRGIHLPGRPRRYRFDPPGPVKPGNDWVLVLEVSEPVRKGPTPRGR